MSEPPTEGAPEGRPAFVANKYLIQTATTKSCWSIGIRVAAAQLQANTGAQVYTVVDSVRLRRSDGAMVRITTSIDILIRKLYLPH